MFSERTLVYTAAERLLLSVCCKLRWSGILLLLMVPIVLWLWFRLTQEGTTTPTLLSPERLDEVLRTFMTTGEEAPTRKPARHRTEALCRSMLERMLGFPLPKCRPPFLRNPTTNRCLELDMFNEEHALAFEFDGAQHTVYTPHYHSNKYHFEYRQLLDRLKTELCAEHGVRLIRISWDRVKLSEPVKTALYLEELLASEGIEHRSIVRSEEVRRRSPGPPRVPASQCTAR